MRTLITGGCGFIGSHLVDRLLAAGDAVTALDDLTTGRAENVAAHAGHPRFAAVVGSVLDRDLVGRHVAACDRVFHLASAVGVKLVCEKPRAAIETIVHGTENVLSAAAARGGVPVLLTSSSEVYGKSRKVPFAEGDDLVLGPPTSPRWSYALAKALDEQLALAYGREGHVPVVVARLFNTVGPRQTGRYGMVVPQFVRAALAGEDLVVHGDGSQRRCFTHVRDVAAALTGLLECPAARGEVVNVGSRNETTIGDLAAAVIRAAGGRSRVRHVPYGEVYGEAFEDVPRRVPCLDKVERLTGWRAARGVEDIVRDVVVEHREGRE